MKLKQKISMTCPTCGCTTIVAEGVEVSRNGERKIAQHVNGERWEHRTFLCGRTVKWVPNFSQELATGVCHNSTDYEKITEQIRGLDEDIRVLNERRHKLYSSL